MADATIKNTFKPNSTLTYNEDDVIGVVPFDYEENPIEAMEVVATDEDGEEYRINFIDDSHSVQKV